MDNKSVEESPKRILLIKLSALGDIIQSLPVLYSLKKTWPKCKVDWITGEVGADLLSGHPLLERVIVYKRKRLGHLAKSPVFWPALLGELRLLFKEINSRGQYDYAIDLQGLFKSGFITCLSRAKEKVGFDRGREFSHLFLTKRLPPYDPDRHAVLRYLDLISAIGADISDIKFPIGLTENDLKRAKDMIFSLGLREKGFVCLIPGTIWPTKRWGSSHFSKLSILLNEHFGLKSLIIGGATDKKLGKEISENSKGTAIDITGKTDLKTLSSIFRESLLAITTDTGPMHLAAATGLKVIAIFGPTAPWRTGPFGAGHIIIRKDVKCSPCFKRNCEDRRCMKEIKPDEVFEQVKIFINSGDQHGTDN